MEETLAYVIREMTSPEGAFYSTQDADSEGEEGRFFVWDSEEVEALLGIKDGALFCQYFDVRPEGNFEGGKSILNVPVGLEDVAGLAGVPAARLTEVVAAGKKVLFEKREERVKPGRDEKVQANWNGLMISAFARAFRVLGRQAYLDTAQGAARFLLEQMRTEEGDLLHTFKDGRARFSGYQDDYAFLICGLLDLYEATFDVEWLKGARELTDQMVAQFWDEEEGGFFFIGEKHESLIVRSKNPYDNAIPSGNALAVSALIRLGALLDCAEYRTKAERTLKLFEPMMRELPSGFGQMLCGLDFFLRAPVEVVVVGSPDSADTRALLDVVNRQWVPNLVVMLHDEANGQEAFDLIPQLAGKKRVEGHATAYVCRNATCSAPVTEVAALEALLADEAGI